MSESFSELFENSETQQNVKPGVPINGNSCQYESRKGDY